MNDIKIEYVKWKDAFYIPGDYAPSNLGGLCIIESAGWLLREDEDYVYLVMEKPQYEDEGVRNPFGILKVNILERRSFTGAKKSTSTHRAKRRPKAGG